MAQDSFTKAQAFGASIAHDAIFRFPKDPTCDICMRAESNKMPARRLAPEKRVESQATKLGERIHADTGRPHTRRRGWMLQLPNIL